MHAQTEHKPPDFGHGAPTDKAPGHWVLARLGKKVLRPGGIELTRRMLETLDIGRDDQVVEFAPGMGATARMTLQRHPAQYTAVEGDPEAAQRMGRLLREGNCRCVVGRAQASGLEAACATVVYGEAMLTMHAASIKHRIVAEAARLLKSGGRYAIHEMAVTPDDAAESLQAEIARELTGQIRHAVQPLTPSGWRALLEAHDLEVSAQSTAPMHLLEPGRILRDEGLAGTARFLFNVLTHGDARRRVLAMRRVLQAYHDHLSAVVMVAAKRSSGG
ncbi:MAG: class I SAM-dependent methyltransferase [Phycisphaerae bacterium]